MSISLAAVCPAAAAAAAAPLLLALLGLFGHFGNMFICLNAQIHMYAIYSHIYVQPTHTHLARLSH